MLLAEDVVVVDFSIGAFRIAILNLFLALSFIGGLAQAEFHSGGSGYSRGYADGPTYGYGGSSARNACDPTSAATNVANPSFGTPLVPGQANPVAAPQTVASAARPAPTPVPAPPPPPPTPSTESKNNDSEASNAKSKGSDSDPAPAPGKDGDSKDENLVAAGKKAFDTKCMSCHDTNGHDAVGDGIARMDIVGEDNGQMPPKGGLSDDEKKSIAAYIASKK